MTTPHEPSPPSHRGRPKVPYIVLAVSLLVTAGAALYVGVSASDSDRDHFENLAERTESGIARRLDAYVDLLRGGAGLFAASERVSAREFHDYVARLQVADRYPGVQGVGASLRILAPHKDATEQSIRNQPGFEQFTIHPPDARPEYHAIIYLEPLDPLNRKAIGYDMFTEPTRRAAMERARDTAEPALSGKVTLVQDEGGDTPRVGFLIYVPLYRGDIPLGVDARRERLLGFVYSPFRANDLFGNVFGGHTPKGIAFDVYDGAETSAPDSLVYASDPAGDQAAEGARFRRTQRMTIAGRPWTLVVRTTPAFESSSARGLTLLALAMGVAVSFVLFGISYGQANAGLRAERAADELRESEQALRVSESKFRRLADANLVGVAFSDTRGRISDANDAFLSTLGRARDEVMDNTLRWDTITPPEHLPADAGAIEQLRATGVCTPYEKQFIRPDGSRVTVLVGLAMLEGETGEMVGICVDLTERNRAVEELKAARDAADAARAEAEDANRLKDEFLATVSHELRTPLNAILGWAGILRTGAAEPEDQSQGIATIERNAKAQAQLINDLLDVSRIVSGKLRLDVRTVDLPHVIDGAIEACRPAADAKGVTVRRVLDPATGPVSGDPDRLQQVVWNLVSNAVKFTPRGGSVQVLLQPRDGNAEIAVSDTGRGISREFLPHVFERFRQADASLTRQHGGLGLGLGIVRHLVELHGGTVAASSLGEGKGATFVVTLPLAVSQEPPGAGDDEPRAHPPRAECPPLTLQGVRVLVVDDDTDSRVLLERLLSDCGATVRSAASAEDAFAAFRRERPDVLLSDIGMPGEDGYSLLRRIRAAEDGAAPVPAIALTALARAEDRKRALAAGYQMHLPKPIEPAELRAAIADLIGGTPVGA